MLKDLCDALVGELPFIEKTTKDPAKFLLSVPSSWEVELFDLSPGVFFFSLIRPCPEKQKEELCTWLMRANVLGQGTGRMTLGLSSNQDQITLSCSFPYSMDLSSFRSSLELFVNYLLYWREEISTFQEKRV